jgi:electron transfer flavoprotein beta subunit
MKILVCISNVPDTTTKIEFQNGDTEFKSAGVQFIINPYDEWYALVRALELKETLGGDVTILHVGGPDSEATIRKGLAIGADNAVRINGDAPDAFYVADQIADYAQKNGFDLILVGKETINYNGSSVGAMVAGIMDLPFVSLATKLDIANNVATMEHDIEGGTEVVECALPLVISCAKGMAEQRIPNMRGIMAARTKPLNVVEPKSAEKLTSITKYELAQGRVACKYIDANNMDELVSLLHNEAKVV